MKKNSPEPLIFIILCVFAGYGLLSGLNTTTSLEPSRQKTKLTSQPSQLKKTQTLESIKDQEKELEKLCLQVLSEIDQGSLLFNGIKIVFRASQEDRELQNQLRDAVSRMKQAAKNTSLFAKKRAPQKLVLASESQNYVTEINNLKTMLSTLKSINLILKKLQQSSGITRKTKTDLKFLLVECKTETKKTTDEVQKNLKTYEIKKYP